jgi:hypothetical protein
VGQTVPNAGSRSARNVKFTTKQHPCGTASFAPKICKPLTLTPFQQFYIFNFIYVIFGEIKPKQK